MEYKKSKIVQQKSTNYNGVGKNALQLKDNRSVKHITPEKTTQLRGLDEEEDELQLKADTAQKMGLDEEEDEYPLQRKENNTGLPDTLKSGIENISGYSMDDVQVHYNSGKPAQLNAHAYAQGTNIHVASGQEKHLPHEAWHVVQQKQGRVKPTMQMWANVNVNDDPKLEKEADVLGQMALSTKYNGDTSINKNLNSSGTSNALQRVPQEVAELVDTIEKPRSRGLFDKYDKQLEGVYRSLYNTLAIKYTNIDNEDKGRQSLMLEESAQILYHFEHLYATSTSKDNTQAKEYRIGANTIASLLKMELKDFRDTPFTGALMITKQPETSVDPQISRAVKDAPPPENITGGFFKENSFVRDEIGERGTYQIDKGVPCQVINSGGGLNEGEVRVEPIADVTNPNYVNFPRSIASRRDILETSRTQTLPGTTHADASHHPLFPHIPPTVEDITQGGIGDCYLMAAVASILPRNPEVIVNMMKDNLDGTVTVRLYDIQERKDGQNSYTPKVIRLNKSVAKTAQGDDAFARGPLWVKMLEKAYAAAGFLGGKTDTVTQNGSGSYGLIEGGFGYIALQHILGRSADLIDTSTVKEESYREGNWAGSAIGKLMRSIPKEEQQKYLDKFDEAGKIKEEIDKLHRENTEVRDIEVAEVLKKYEVWGSLFQQFINQEGIYPGKRFTGRYSKNQIELFNEIKNSVDQKAILTIGTKEKIATKPSKDRGHSAGETKAKGLVGNHEYTILDYRTRDKGIKEVLLRNPWGSYGRKYDTSGFFSDKLHAKADENSGGVFWLELSDLTKRFSGLSRMHSQSGTLEESQNPPQIEITQDMDQVMKDMGIPSLKDLLFGEGHSVFDQLYKKTAKKYHPDLGGDAELFKALQTLADIRENPEKYLGSQPIKAIENKV